MSLTVKKVRRLPKAKTVATVSVTPVDATSVRVTGGVSTTKAQAARVTGKAFLVFDRLEGTKWKRMHKVRRGAGRSVDVTKVARARPLARQARLQGQEALQEVGLGARSSSTSRRRPPDRLTPARRPLRAAGWHPSSP